MLAKQALYHYCIVAIVSKRPLARSKTLVSFDHLLSTHHQRREVLLRHGELEWGHYTHKHKLRM